MSAIKPFNGLRFFGRDISKLVCPPYDIISEKEKKELKRMSRFNIVSVELPEAKGSKNKYKNAKTLLNDWIQKGILEKDEDESFYIHEQIFKDNGKIKSRKGFFAILKLENPHKGSIKPHEKTLAKPKEDRLNLIRAVQANISPIFGLFNDNNKSVVRLCEEITKEKESCLAKDKNKIIHKLWKVSDAPSINTLVKALKNQNVFIADGHHRYETAWNYMQERKKTSGYKKDAVYNYVLIYLCAMEEPGLVVWPTHRVLSVPENLEANIKKYFKVLPKSAYNKEALKNPQGMLVYYKKSYRTLAVKNPGILLKAMPDKCKAYRDLGVSILHNLLLKDVLPENITYVKNEQEAYKLADKTNRMAVIVPSTPVEAVKEIAQAGQTMPQKSTYFYPKVSTGMVISKF